MPDTLLLKRVRIAGGARSTDVLMRDGLIAKIGARLSTHAGQVVDGRGGALLAGLHDHHLHLLAWAAARESVLCGPPEVRTVDEFAARLASACPRSGWVRGVGYHESVAGDLDASALDRLRADVPVRVQHRSGALWMVNSAGAAHLGLENAGMPGVERDRSGRPNGRLWRLDGWLAERVAAVTPDIAGVWRELASYGVVGATDATPDLRPEAARLLRATARGRLLLLGAADEPERVPVKLVVPDHAPARYDDLVAAIRSARPRPVAVHCVTRVALVVCLAALAEVHGVAGDRIEHAAVVPPDAARALRSLRVSVVTQPSFIAARGDDYLRDVDPDDRPYLWPYASLLEAGIPVGVSSDAPYGHPDPWRTVAAAVSRRTPTGRILGESERVSPRIALRGYLAAPECPGGAPRRISVGAPADLVLLEGSLDDALADPTHERVRLTIAAGSVVYRREQAL
jgi:predicted amidohydrolase YtcJ